MQENILKMSLMQMQMKIQPKPLKILDKKVYLSHCVKCINNITEAVEIFNMEGAEEI